MTARAIRFRFAVLALPFLAGCPAPSSPSNPDASDAATYTDVAVQACAAMLAAGCAEGTASNCANDLRLGPVDHHTTAKAIGCAAAAKTKADVRACDPAYFECK